MILVLLVPIALFLFVSAEELAVVLFGYGAAELDAAAKVGHVTALFALGLPAFSLIYVINRIWYATENTKTPFVFSILINVLAVGIGIALFGQAQVSDKVAMFGLSYSIAYWICLCVSLWWLIRTINAFEISSILTLSLKIVLASSVSAGFMWWAIATYPELFTGNSKNVFLTLSLLWIVATCIYFALAALLQVKEIKDVASILTTRFNITR